MLRESRGEDGGESWFSSVKNWVWGIPFPGMQKLGGQVWAEARDFWTC